MIMTSKLVRPTPATVRSRPAPPRLQLLAHLSVQAAPYLGKSLAPLLQDKRRAHAPQPLREILPGEALPARALFHATQQARLRVIQALQAIVEPAPRVDAGEALRGLRQAVALCDV